MNRRCRRTVAIVTAAIVVSACTGGAHSQSGSAAVPTSPAGLTNAERLYGLAPSAHPDVTFQPDVVVVGGGANSVISATADGMTWTLKPSSPHVNELALGKVMLLTNQSTGRVIALDRNEEGVVVTLAPVPLGEVFKEAQFSFHVPISPDQLGWQATPQPGGSATVPSADSVPLNLGGGAQSPTTPPSSASTTPSGSQAAAPRARGLEQTATFTAAVQPCPSSPQRARPACVPDRQPAGVSAQLMDEPGGADRGFFGEAFGSYAGATGFASEMTRCGTGSAASPPPPLISAVQPFQNTNGLTLSPAYSLGVSGWEFEGERLPGQLTFRAARDAGPLKIGIVFRVFFSNLSLSGTDTIHDGKETPSGVHLEGINRVTIGFLGGASSATSNARFRIDIPINSESLTYQGVGPYGVPFVLALKPKFIVETAFSAGNSTLWDCGDYGLSSGNGGLVPGAIRVVKSLLPVNGLSIGVDAVVVAFEVKAQLGMGLKFAYAGPFATVDVAIGVTRGSDIGLVNCQGADLLISGKAGAGLSVNGNSLQYINELVGKSFLPGKAGATAAGALFSSQLPGWLKLSKGLSPGQSFDLDFATNTFAIYPASGQPAHKVEPPSAICR